MNAGEWRATIMLTFVSVLRMLGMFMILPVFAPFATHLPGGATPFQIGLAIAAFGLVQSTLQIPFGIASDRHGRRLVVVVGILMFAFGNFVAGHVQQIHWIMAGRALQGAGAVSAAVAAWLADVTRDGVRAQAMAIHGAGVGLSFVLALVLGPVFAGWIGVDGIFVMTGILALLSVPLLLFGVPGADTSAGAPSEAAVPRTFSPSLFAGPLLSLDGGVFLLNAMMTAMFAAAPFAIAQTLGLANPDHWKFYLPVLVGAMLLVWPLLRGSRLRGQRRAVFLGAIVMLAISMSLAAMAHDSPVELVAGFVMFFMAFSYLQATMPAMVSQLARPDQRGAALGMFGTAQVLGAAIGNLLGGYARGQWNIAAAFVVAAMLAIVWLTFAWSAPVTRD